MTQYAFQTYIEACAEAGINPNRIVQTIGGAVASAGTHAKMGQFTLTLANGTKVKRDYTACADIRTRDLSDGQVINLIRAMAKRGHCAFWRKTGSFANNQHIHTVYAGCYINNPVVLRQVYDFLDGKSGLVGHYSDFYWGKNPIGTKTRALILKNLRVSNPNARLGEDIEDETEEDFICSCCTGDTLVPDDEVQGIPEENIETVDDEE